MTSSHQLDPTNMAWLQKLPTMLVGIDVTHPSPKSVKGTPSIAAVVASVDHLFAQYPASMEIQKSKKEVSILPILTTLPCPSHLQMVTRLENMMYERLRLYKSRNKNMPQRVLVYRDGVSEV